VQVAERASDVEVVCSGSGSGGTTAFREEISAQEGLEIAVEDLIDVANFHLGAMILGHAVGLQDVGTDLGAEVDVELGVLEFL